MERTQGELAEAKRQIESLAGKLRKALESMRAKRDGRRRGSQITLAERRLRAFGVALELIGAELAKRGEGEERPGTGKVKVVGKGGGAFVRHPAGDGELDGRGGGGHSVAESSRGPEGPPR